MMRIAYHPMFCHPLPEGHRFPMLKYELIPAQLLYEGTILQEQLFAPEPIEEETVLLTHEAAYWQKLKNQTLDERAQRKIGFVQSPLLTEREMRICQGTLQCAEHALQNGIALNVAGGTHHAYADHGEGFCLLNDFAVAARYLLQQARIKQALIIDLDVHQGNGSAAIFATEPRVFTFSMHGAHNYPFHKERSDLDIGLPDGTGDATYLSLLRENLPALIERVRPDLAFFLSGVDILQTDKFGKLNITPEGCSARDETVFSLLKKRDIPCVVAMGGGYSHDIRDIVHAHCNTFKIAADVYA